jgi:Tol biopolymer transport system component
MSPEQARGGATDFRTDQFSLGLVMYEMATGVQAFRAETREKTLSAIIGDEPRPIAELNPRVPAGLRWVIERCLAKDPRERYGSTLDLAHDLHALSDRLADITPATQSARARPRRRALTGWSAVPLVVGLGAGIWLTALALPPIDFAYQYIPIATASSFQGAPAWSPDDKHLAYVAEVNGLMQVFTREIGGSGDAQQLTSRKFDCHDPFWSPDGLDIYFISRAGYQDALWSVDVATHALKKLIDNVNKAAVSDNTLALLRSTGGLPGHEKFALWTANTADYNPQQYMRPPFDTLQMDSGVLHFSPDGSRLGVSGQNWIKIAGPATRHMGPHFWSITLSAPAQRQVHEVFTSLPNLPAGAFQFSWWPDNRHVVAAINDLQTGSHLWMLDIDDANDMPPQFTAGVLRDDFPAVSLDGKRIAHTQGIVDFDIYEVPLDGSKLRPALTSSRNELSPSWSQVDSQFAYETDMNGFREIRVRREPTPSDRLGYDRALVTPGDFPDRGTYLGNPAISPDGEMLAFERSGPTPRWRIYIKDLQGSFQPKPLYPAADGTFDDQPMWSPDSNWVTFNEASQDGTGRGIYQLMKASVKKEGPPERLLPDITDDPCPWSDDSKWIACQTPKGLTLVSPDGQPVSKVTDLFFLAFGWASDSRTIYGIRVSDDGVSMSLSAVDTRTGHEKIINPNLGVVPRLDLPVRGFSRVGDHAFLTSIVKVTSEIWMLKGFPGPPGLFERWFSRLRSGHLWD